MGSLSLLQEIFPTQGLNTGPPHCRRILHWLSHKGNRNLVLFTNPPADARDTGWILGPEIPTYATEQLSPGTTATEPVLESAPAPVLSPRAATT